MTESKEVIESYGEDILKLSNRITALTKLKIMTENNDVFTESELKIIQQKLEESTAKKTKMTTEFMNKINLYENDIEKKEIVILKRTTLIDQLYDSCNELRLNDDLMDIFSTHHNLLKTQIKNTEKLIQ